MAQQVSQGARYEKRDASLWHWKESYRNVVEDNWLPAVPPSDGADDTPQHRAVERPTCSPGNDRTAPAAGCYIAAPNGLDYGYSDDYSHRPSGDRSPGGASPEGGFPSSVPFESGNVMDRKPRGICSNFG